MRSIFEGLALLDFSDLEASIESTESTEMTDACGSCAEGKKRPVFFMTKLQWCQTLRVRRRFPGVSYIFLIMACPST